MATKEVSVMTVEGAAVATKEKNGDPWRIGYPWGDARFYGSAPEVRSLMEKTIKDAGQEPTEE